MPPKKPITEQLKDLIEASLRAKTIDRRWQEIEETLILSKDKDQLRDLKYIRTQLKLRISEALENAINEK
jgi:hypothetical protein